MKVLVVDDEELSLLELEYILNKIKYISDIKKASSGFEALELCQMENFDVVFLDIRLGDSNGVRVAQRLMENERPPKIVFVTAFDEYAVKAFELEAVDYVLKPFSEERIKKTLDRLKNILNQDDHIKYNVTNDNIKAINKLAVELDGKITLLDLEEIVFIEADGRNSIIRTSTQEYNTNISLKDLETRLKSATFFRPHRSFIINLQKINEVIRWFNGTYIIKMQGYDKVQIPVTKKNTDAFKKILNI